MTKHLSREERREQILDAAEALFIEKGYEAARINDIAERAGLSKGAIYFRYESKRDLFIDCIRHHFEEIQEIALGDASTRTQGLEDLLGVAERFARFIEKSPRSSKFMLVMTEAAVRDEEIRTLLVEHYHRPIVAAIGVALRGDAMPLFSAMKLDEIDPELATLAQLVKSVIDGLSGSYAIGQPIDLNAVIRIGYQAISVLSAVSPRIAASG